MVQDVADGNLVGDRELVVRQLPALQIIIDVAVQIERAGIDEFEGRQRSERLADGAGLKQRVWRRCNLAFFICEAIGAGPVELAVANHGDADGVDVQLRHAFCERDRRAMLAVYDDERADRALHRRDHGWRLSSEDRRRCEIDHQQEHFHWASVSSYLRSF